MAAALHMPHRPSVDRTQSFDRPRSTPPFTTGYERTPSPSVLQHSRTNSNHSSHHSPYQQPFPQSSQSYFPQSNQVFNSQPQAWSTTALPASSFYPAATTFQTYPNQPIFHPGFQQSNADFAAWANAYHHMVMASVAAGGVHQGAMTPPPPQPEYQADTRRRSTSGPQPFPPTYLDQQNQPAYTAPQASNISKLTAQSKPFHPYKRGPTHQTSRENMTRSASQPSLSKIEQRPVHVPASSISSSVSSSKPSFTQEHQRDSSIGSSASSNSVVPPPRVGFRDDGRRESFSSDRDAQSVKEEKVVRTMEPSQRTASPSSNRASPLTPGPISNATNAPLPSSRPSPLSQAPMAPSPEPTEKMVKSGGLKGRLRRALDKDSKKEQKSVPSTPTKVVTPPQTPKTMASPSETSTRSSTPPTTPSTPPLEPLGMPQPRFAVSHSNAMNSDVSLAETERTATTAAVEPGKEKGRKGLFRMKNMSTDNISLSSTVSSASMMIRKMGSLGKLARRNSLMGISKIFKDKPKDEDGALPEKEGKKKKEKKSKSKKGDSVAPELSRITSENERLVAEEDERVLAGLSPAAKLARQHTLRSRAAAAEAARQLRSNGNAQANEPTGEPTWDQNTTTRPQGILPSISSVSSPTSPTSPTMEVLHIRPRTSSVTAVAIEQEYDSEDDSSDGETVEDLTATLGRARLEDADVAFRAEWRGAYIDRNAVPKKGILKSKPLTNEESAETNRSRQNAVPVHIFNPQSGPQLKLSQEPDQIDGLHHPTPKTPTKENFDPFTSFTNEPFAFDTNPSTSSASGPTNSIYSNVTANTSLPAISVLQDRTPNIVVNGGQRSMTAPMRKRLVWAPECAVYSTYDAGTYDRRSEPATCNRLTPELAMAIKQELNAFKLEMPVHPSSRVFTHYFA